MGAITQPIGSIVGAGIDAASSAATNATNVAIAKRNNDTSKQIAQQNNATQIQMNDTNNQFSHDEAELAYQRDLEKMNLENNYNSPVEQMKRFQEAGINPTLGFLGNAAMPAANSSGSPMASPHGSGITPSMPQFQNPAMNPFSIGQAVKAFVDAKKAGVESRTLESAMDSILKTYEHNARYAENQADMAEMDNWLKTVYGKQRYNAETNEILERTYKFTQEALLAQKQGDLATAQKQRDLAHEEVLKLDKQYRQKEVDSFDKLLDSKLDNIAADTAKSRAEAERAHAEAITEDTLRELRRDLLGSEAELRGVDAQTERALFDNGLRYSERVNQIQHTAAERGLSQIERNQAEELYPIIVAQAAQDRQKGDMKSWQYYVDKTISALAGSAGAAAGAYVGARVGSPGKARPVRGFGQ